MYRISVRASQRVTVRQQTITAIRVLGSINTLAHATNTSSKASGDDIVNDSQKTMTPMPMRQPFQTEKPCQQCVKAAGKMLIPNAARNKATIYHTIL
jgi:hypothetical protein